MFLPNLMSHLSSAAFVLSRLMPTQVFSPSSTSHQKSSTFNKGPIYKLLANSLNPTSVLVSYIGSHQHEDCLNKCMVDWLLERGADPHGSGHRVTPLQIAVSNGDFHGVKSLL